MTTPQDVVAAVEEALEPSPTTCVAKDCHWDTRGTAGGAGPAACFPWSAARPKTCLLAATPVDDVDEAEQIRQRVVDALRRFK